MSRKRATTNLTLPVFSHSFFLSLPLISVTPTVLPPPPPSRPNASRRWCFDPSTMTATSLASKHESEVVSTHLPRPPPPSHPNASQRWSFFKFRHICHNHHLPRVQMRAGGGFFRLFRPIYHDDHLPRVQMRARGGFFFGFDTSTTSTTSLASKRELGVVLSSVSTSLPPPPPPPSHPNTSRRRFFRRFRRACHHHHLPHVQTQAGGGFFVRFDRPATTTSLASKCELEVVLSSVLMHLPPPPAPSCPNASWRWILLDLLMRLLPPPPPLHLASKRELGVEIYGILTHLLPLHPRHHPQAGCHVIANHVDHCPHVERQLHHNRRVAGGRMEDEWRGLG